MATVRPRCTKLMPRKILPQEVFPGERATEKPKRDPPTKTLIKELVPTDSRQKATHTKLDIIDLRPLMRGFTIECIILDVLLSRNTNSGMVFSFLVADTTAVCTLVVWQYGECLNPGDMLRITNGEVRIYDGKMEICASKRDGTIRRYDENVMKFVETEEPNLSKFLWCEAPSSPLDIALNWKKFSFHPQLNQ
ncbi:4860_t:CDS:2 [Paraglomus brasilianum]|uniref:4860_t:CDS:1 n=1 Tax=Paraglomus brasilianum TaxID=144538 RepID=A0A9N9B0X6_9GLOM|nr:4860_t:CDS:2 [Paraglomus brasilianum]